MASTSTVAASRQGIDGWQLVHEIAVTAVLQFSSACTNVYVSQYLGFTGLYSRLAVGIVLWQGLVWWVSRWRASINPNNAVSAACVGTITITNAMARMICQCIGATCSLLMVYSWHSLCHAYQPLFRLPALPLPPPTTSTSSVGVFEWSPLVWAIIYELVCSIVTASAGLNWHLVTNIIPRWHLVGGTLGGMVAISGANMNPATYTANVIMSRSIPYAHDLVMIRIAPLLPSHHLLLT
jgi:glycerol uptake facilitator-like aquaporin